MNAPVAAIKSDAPLDLLDLNFRVTNRLASAGIFRVGDLCVCSASDLLKMPGFGVKSLQEVERSLQRAGRSLRKEDPQ
ncbi:DNA-directed RNA polymerase subunit alpha [Paraburkholderia graminis C4D1M]|uniref:RNA polymerase alpha subunit domain protein n=1 Tax=Paraburkholderia graminis (strain ATCC 700544 / DSM 17151 / LMG 18924 / NCIMB 13744 / C4D1M) TaxID=396598 RepID=B1G5N0_PARG4|nr:DNA-directed RNA polymerase subunit alpha C-terminal domain-containing protein [Paraburkholderia graminis]EDT08481.1 RNA polymerase alpha subunit domain protein [Paraburkholderia graminis C4D1M]CAB3681393.1 DNA-directed RNA polymerase subunit alpha [Paraburkholderia graminis C4D1M]